MLPSRWPVDVVVPQRAEQAEDGQRREERREDVAREHRGPGEVERMHEEQQGGDEPAGPSPKRLPEGVEEADAQRGDDRDGRDHPGLAEPEDAAREGGGEPPGDPVGRVIGKDVVVDEDVVDEVPVDDFRRLKED